MARPHRRLMSKRPDCYELTEHSDTKKHSPFQVWENIIGQSCDCKAALEQKIYNVKDFKLKEFNFKVIHRILSCEINLKKMEIARP